MTQESNLVSTNAQNVLEKALSEDRPIVALLGQAAGQHPNTIDSVCSAALTRLGIEGSSWNDIFSIGPLSREFYIWLNERFERHTPTTELVALADAHFSTVFTSSFDPVLRNLFESDGRQPITVVAGDPLPPISRSKLQPRIHYLFGMTGTGEYEPPNSRLALRARLAQHATPMLNTLFDIATPLGITVIEGFRAGHDWLNPSEILGQISLAPSSSVLWFGTEPDFTGEDAEVFNELVESGIVIRDERPLGVSVAEANASGAVSKLQTWNEAGIISFSDNQKLITTPSMRLGTEASAAIIDDSWMDHLQPLSSESDEERFAFFHSVPSNHRVLFDGVRRHYAIEREFEDALNRQVSSALRNHAKEKGAIVLSGQSGIGKSIALHRLAVSVRENKSAAVLFARDRIPLATEIAYFLSEVDKLDQVTLLIVDSLAPPKRYDTLLESLRSRGHRVVVLGTSYSTELSAHRHSGRMVAVTAKLTENEVNALQDLADVHVTSSRATALASHTSNALARFFWTLPFSRSRIASGLGREARHTVRELGEKRKSKIPVQEISAMAHALLKAGYTSEAPILVQDGSADEQESSAGKLVDYIMVCSRVHRWVPINIVLRALISDRLYLSDGIGTDIIRDLFDGHDLFRWRYSDSREDQLLVGARLQLEAQLICDQRLGGPRFEVNTILELISNASRAGPDGSEETRFVADMAIALGPDGPLGDRYRESYADIARELTKLRKEQGVRNARLMLQEATLRRHFIRRNETKISEEDHIKLLDEAREAVEEALSEALDLQDDFHAARRTIRNLWVERAATYGFLATSSARRSEGGEKVWSHYVAAREATRNATGRVDSYYPLDISLWLPLDILSTSLDLGLEKQAELKADVLSSIDMVDEDALDVSDAETFQKQCMRAGEILDDEVISEEAFEVLDKSGSSAGYFLRAKSMSPRPISGEQVANSEQVDQAVSASGFLFKNRGRIVEDPRSLRLLLNCLWLAQTKRWLFHGLRQPLPQREEEQRHIIEVLADLAFASGRDDLPPRYRYLAAVMAWLTGDEKEAKNEFLRLGTDTEFVDAKRVLPRHIIFDNNQLPALFSGFIDRKIGDRRWSVMVRELNRRVSYLPRGRGQDARCGMEIKNFTIAFNYIGPHIDRVNRK